MPAPHVPLIPSLALTVTAERLPDRVFVTDEQRRSVTYGELADRSARIAALLDGIGVRRGDRVATMLDPGLDYLAVWFGVCATGALEVPVNTAFGRLPPSRAGRLRCVGRDHRR